MSEPRFSETRSRVPVARACLIPLVVLAASACDEPDPTSTSTTIEVVALGELQDALYPTLLDTVLAAPSDFFLVDDRIYVAEPRASRLTVLDLDLDLVRRIGRPGKGPGELTSPQTVRSANGVVSVADAGTGRFEFFDSAGVGLGSIPLRAGSEHVLLGLRSVIAIDRDPLTVATLLDSSEARPFGVVADGAEDSRETSGPVPMHQLHRARLDGDSVIVRIPDSTGSLEILDFSGMIRETRELPHGIMTELHDHQEDLASMFGGALMASSMVKGAGVSPDGRFVTVASMAESAPIMIHDLDGRRLILVDVSDHLQEGKVQSARVAVFHEGLLYVLAGGSMFAFELELPE